MKHKGRTALVSKRTEGLKNCRRIVIHDTKAIFLWKTHDMSKFIAKWDRFQKLSPRLQVVEGKSGFCVELASVPSQRSFYRLLVLHHAVRHKPITEAFRSQHYCNVSFVSGIYLNWAKLFTRGREQELGKAMHCTFVSSCQLWQWKDL